MSIILTDKKQNFIFLITKSLYLFAIFAFMFNSILPGIGGITGKGIGVSALVLIFTFFWIIIFEGKFYTIKNNTSLIMNGIILLFVFYFIIIGLIAQQIYSLPLSEFIIAIAPAIRTVIYAFFYFIGVHIYIKDKEYIKKVIKFMIFFILIHFLYGVIQFMAYEFKVPDPSLLPYTGLRVDLAGDIYEYMNPIPTGFTARSFTLANYGLVLVCISLSLIGINQSLSMKVKYFLLLIIGYLTVLVTFRRSQLVVVALVTLIHIILSRMKRFKKIVFLITILIVLTLPFAFIEYIYEISPVYANRIQSIISFIKLNWSDPNLRTLKEGRIQGTWENYFGFFSEYPLGTGLHPVSIFSSTVDNAYLLYLTWGGFLGLILFIALVLTPIAL